MLHFFLRNVEYRQSASYFNVFFCWQLAGSSTARLPVILINPQGENASNYVVFALLCDFQESNPEVK